MERSQINLGYVGSFEVTQELFALSKSGISVDSPNGGGFDNEKISYNHSQDVLGLYLGAKKIAGVKDLSPDFEGGAKSADEVFEPLWGSGYVDAHKDGEIGGKKLTMMWVCDGHESIEFIADGCVLLLTPGSIIIFDHTQYHEIQNVNFKPWSILVASIETTKTKRVSKRRMEVRTRVELV